VFALSASILLSALTVFIPAHSAASESASHGPASSPLISLLHLAGVPWARIGEHVGQRSLRVTADTYSHVLSDERELSYADLLRR
jgi:hypothetical protein